MKKSISLLLFCSIAWSCSSGFEKKVKYDTALELGEVVSIELDSLTSYEFLNVYYYDNDTVELLFNVNKLINGFNVYDLNSKKLVSQVSLPKIGPGSVRDINGMTILNLDSIYLFSRAALREILVVDYLGEAKTRLRSPSAYKEDGTPGSFPFISHASSNRAPTLALNGKLYFSKYSNFDYYMASNINESYSAEISYDLNTLTIEPLPVGFPEWMHNQIWHMYHLLHAKTLNARGEFVYSFSGEDSIRVGDLTGKKKAYLAKHDDHKESNKPYANRPRPEKQLEDGLESFIYTHIIYDKYRDVYYRIVEKPLEYNPEKHKNFRAYYSKSVGCVILDAEFRKIGEADFPDGIYRTYGAFVGRKGLYIPRLNPEYDALSEDHVEYSIYKLSTN